MDNLPSSPRQLDGADVVLWGVSRRSFFHTIPHDADPGGEGVVRVAAMAICRYAGGDRFYLFKCDAGWNVVFDWDAGSVEEAQEVATAHAKDETIHWLAPA